MLNIKKYDLTRVLQIVYNLTMAPLLELVKLINIRLTRCFRFASQILRRQKTSKEQSVHSGLLPGIEYVATYQYQDSIELAILKVNNDQVQINFNHGYVTFPAAVLKNFDIVGEL